MQMLTGIVENFFSEKFFGFIKGTNGARDIFFHFLDGRHVVPRGHGLVKFEQSPTPLRHPKRGDRLTYILGNNATGPKATQWCFAEDYDQAKYESLVLSGQPKSPMPFNVAAKLLAESHFWCLRDCAFGDEEFGWDLLDGGDKVAGGGYGRGGYNVWVSETKFYLDTTFNDTEAKRLYDAGGKTNRFERNDAGDPRGW